MKTNIGKIFAVFTTVVCLAFMSVSVLVSVAGPNWQAISYELEGEGYKLAKNPDGTWVSTRGRDGAPVKSSKILPEVLIQTFKDADSSWYQPQTTDASTTNKQLEDAIKDVEKAIREDDGALKKYYEDILAQLEQVRANRQDVSKKVIQKTEQAQEVQSETRSRRDDVYRMRIHLKEVEADKYRLEEIARSLKDQIEQLNGGLERAGARSQQLQSKGKEEYNPKSAKLVE